MATSKRTGALPAADNIPLRLRRRRDGSLVLTDADGRVDSAGRVWPSRHVFSHPWLLESKAAEIEGDGLTVVLANARATYRVIERGPGGIDGELVDAEVYDAAPIDEKRAAELAAEREG